ncbi:hypothetical protein LTR95_000644 [Oleoguttula sp. CCFEE 5521]
MLVNRQSGGEYTDGTNQECIIFGKFYMAYIAMLRQPDALQGIARLQILVSPIEEEHCVHNIATALEWGRILAVALRRCLPSLQVFEWYAAKEFLPTQG